MKKTRDFIIIKKSKINSKDYNNLKNVLHEGSDLVKNENSRLSAESQIIYYFDLTWEYLSRISNIEKELEKNYLSKEIIRRDFFKIFEASKKCDDDKLIKSLMKKINIRFIKSKEINPEIFKFVFYTNMKIHSNQKVVYNKLLNVFNIKAIKFEDIKFETEDSRILKYFRSSNELLEVQVKSRTEYHAFEEAEKIIHKFFGFLSFIQNHNKGQDKFHVNEYALQYSFTLLSILSYIILDENYSFKERFSTASNRMHYKITNIKEEKLKFNKSLEFYFNEYEKISNSSKKEVKNNLDNILRLYYYATSENNLDSSFLKFWSLNERILKEMLGDMKDRKLLKSIKNVLKIYGKFIQIENRLDIIYEKRNQLVHENISDKITNNDRNLAKTITDHIIYFYIGFFKHVNNIKEYGFILENVHKTNTEIERSIQILNNINSLKENTN